MSVSPLPAQSFAMRVRTVSSESPIGSFLKVLSLITIVAAVLCQPPTDAERAQILEAHLAVRECVSSCRQYDADGVLASTGTPCRSLGRQMQI
ncbi:hypothetical protein TcWFU_003774 [Taenia crassiceps]|uniref:Uncharacterized protein n=1 Tax=Taenia crassiceps TaxID=6207 RepID=A0ABR4PZK9_9CEST